MKPKILVTREVFDETLARLNEHFEVESNQGDTPFTADELAARLADKEYVLTASSDKIDAALLARCPKLKAVCNIAVGYNNIDISACTARGVMATNTPGVLTETTADFAWALLLAAARRIPEAEEWLRAGNWKRVRLKDFLGIDVHHATLGIVGMGRIGQAVARRARGFDMRVLYSNRNRLPSDIERECNATFVSRSELLQNADFVTLHLPYSAENHHVIGAEQLAQMKRGAVLVNVARGGVVDDAALIRALKSGHLAAAGIDVFENEPKFDPGFLELKNVVLAPHIGSSSSATRLNMSLLAAKNAIAVATTGTPPNLLNPDVLKHQKGA